MDEDKKERNAYEQALQAGAAEEVVKRYGSAIKEHIVAYGGVDNETGKVLNRSLKSISNNKVSSDANIKQQAGYSAEVKVVANKNAEKIIAKNSNEGRYVRTDDIGRCNDQLLDIVFVDKRGNVIERTGEQLKFVGRTPKECFDKLNLSRFQKYIDADAKLVVPSDYYEGILNAADERISKCEKQLKWAESNGDTLKVEKIKEKIGKCNKIKKLLKNSGITKKEAEFARLHPKLSALKSIGGVAHRAGKEQAILGASIAGGISLVKNFIAVIRGEKTPEEAGKSLVEDTGGGAVGAYVIAFSGAVIKGSMQNATGKAVRALSKTNLPAVIATSTIEMGKTIKKYVCGQITGIECIEELGEKGISNLSSAMFATLGIMVVGSPVVGGMIGSMAGYALGSALYKSVMGPIKEAKLVHEERLRLESECREEIKRIVQYREEFNAKVAYYIQDYTRTFDDAFRQMDKESGLDGVDDFILGVNQITLKMGEKPFYRDYDEFKKFMQSNNSLII